MYFPVIVGFDLDHEGREGHEEDESSLLNPFYSFVFLPGSRVKSGGLLFVIDPRPYQAKLDEAKAELVRRQAELKQAVSRSGFRTGATWGSRGKPFGGCPPHHGTNGRGEAALLHGL